MLIPNAKATIEKEWKDVTKKAHKCKKAMKVHFAALMDIRHIQKVRVHPGVCSQGQSQMWKSPRFEGAVHKTTRGDRWSRNTMQRKINSNEFGEFWELISRFEFDFCRCGNHFLERFEFLVCSKFNHTQCGRTCACAVACLHTHTQLHFECCGVVDDWRQHLYIYIYIYIYIHIDIYVRDVAKTWNFCGRSKHLNVRIHVHFHTHTHTHIHILACCCCCRCGLLWLLCIVVVVVEEGEEGGDKPIHVTTDSLRSVLRDCWHWATLWGTANDWRNRKLKMWKIHWFLWWTSGAKWWPTWKKFGKQNWRCPPCVHSKRPRVCRHHAHMWRVSAFSSHIMECFPLALPSLGVFSWRRKNMDNSQFQILSLGPWSGCGHQHSDGPTDTQTNQPTNSPTNRPTKQAQASEPKQASPSKQAQASKPKQASPSKQAQASKPKQASPSKQAQASKPKQASPSKQAQASKLKQASPSKQAQASKPKQASPSKQAQASKPKQATQQARPPSKATQQGHPARPPRKATQQGHQARPPIHRAGVICARGVWFMFFGGCVYESQEKILEPSYTHLSSVWPWSMRSSRTSLHIVHSVECLHVVRMVESHICTNRLRIHLECIHPFMKFWHYFWWRSTLTWICCQMRCSTIQYNQESKGFVSNLCRSTVWKDDVSKFFCTKSGHARSFRSWLYWIAKWTCLHHVLVKAINSFRNILMSGALLELRGGHMVVLQVKVLQVTLVRQLVDNVSEGLTFCVFSKIEDSSVRLRESLDTSCYSIAVGSCHTSGSFFLLSLCGLRMSRRSRRNQRCKVFVINGLITPFLKRFLSWCWPHKWSVILIFIPMHVWYISWECWLLLWHGKGYMSLWVTRSITRFSRGLIRKTRQVQHNMSHCGICSWTRKQAKSWACNLVSHEGPVQ